MTEDRLSQIRTAIAAARRQERQTHQLEIYLTSLAPRLHKAINLPQENSAAALLQFVERYIEHAPDFLAVLATAMERNGVLACGTVFLEIATDFFLQPPEVVHHDGGLRALIDEAYLAHRLIEEINDRLLILCGVPLAPMDMTMANIIVHQLLGEEFANQLDLAVHYAVEALFQPDQLRGDSRLARFVVQHSNSGGSYAADWPCMADDAEIHLNFAARSAKVTEH